MPTWGWWALGAGVAVVLATALALAARRDRDRLTRLLRFVPDCLVLLRELMRDPEVPRRAKVVAGLTVAYLASPIDLVPDVIPVLGYLDDVLVVAWALRRIVAVAGRPRVAAHWRGDQGTLETMLRLVRVS